MRQVRSRVFALAAATLALAARSSSAVVQSANATATCSAAAVASWQAKCAVRTAGNKDLLPLTNMAASEINIDERNLVDTYEAARLTALKLSGAAGSAAMRGMRKKTPSWYAASLRHVVTYLCVETSDASEFERCVASNSSMAARDVSNTCVALTDTDSCSRKGLCERTSNCKWDDAVPNATTRRELFSAANASAATKWIEQGYPQSLAAFVAPGIVFAVLTALTCVGFTVLRCVFNQCGGRNPREKGYTRCDIVIPSMVFLGCTFAVVICSIVTVAQNANISDGVNGVLFSLNATLANIDIFAANLQTPLAAAATNVQAASAAVATRTRDLDWVATDGATLRSMLEDFATIYSAQGPFPAASCNTSVSTTCVACPDAVCGAPLKAYTTTALSIATHATTLVAGTTEALQTTFVDKASALVTGIRTAHNELAAVSAMTTRSKQLVAVVHDTFDAYSFSRGALVFAIFFFALIASALGTFAIVKSVCTKQAKTAWVQLLHVTWTLGTLVCILGFVLSASLLAVGAVWYDSCQYMALLQTDVAPYMPQQLATIVNACFRDESILAPLGLESHLGFACALDDASAALRTTDLTALKTLTAAYSARVADFGLRDFGYSSTTSRELLAAATAAAADASASASKSFTQESVVVPWTVYSEAAPTAAECSSYKPTNSNGTLSVDDLPLCYMDHKCGASGTAVTSAKAKCRSAFVSAYTYVLAYNKVGSVIDAMREDLVGDTGKGFSPQWRYSVSITEFADAYVAKLAAARTATLDALLTESGAVGRVLASVETLRCGQSCGWLNISFNAMHTAMCHDLLGTTLAIALCVLFLVLFLIPMVVTAVTLQKRLRGVKKGTYEQLERRLQALETKTKDEARAKAAAASGGAAGGSGSSSKMVDLFSLKKNIDSA